MGELMGEDLHLTEDGCLPTEYEPVYKGVINGYPVYQIGPCNELCNWFVCSKSRRGKRFPLATFRSQDDMEIMMQSNLIEV